MAQEDRSTRVARKLSERMTRVAQNIQGDNPLGLGVQQFTPAEYQRRWMKMTGDERDAAMQREGPDMVLDRLRGA